MLENYKKCKKYCDVIEMVGYEKTGFPTSLKESVKTFIYAINNNTKIVSLDKKYFKLLTKTNNNIFPRKPPFLDIFIDTLIEVGTIKLYGILVSTTWIDYELLNKMKGISKEAIKELKLDRNSLCKLAAANILDLEIDEVEAFRKIYERKRSDINIKDIWEYVKEKKYSLICLCFGEDSLDNTTVFKYLSINFDENKEEIAKIGSEYGKDIDKTLNEIDEKCLRKNTEKIDGQTSKKLDDEIKLLVCNMLDFFNHPEVELVENNFVHLMNKRRKKHGKYMIKPHKIIKVTGKLAQFINEYEEKEKKFKYGHKFWVRGHYMRFWDKDIYHKLYEKFEENKLDGRYYLDEEYNVLMTWKKPFIKGEGILVNKVYEVKEVDK